MDWNCSCYNPIPHNRVTPCVGVWIETTLVPTIASFPKSHPAWVCGLKLHNYPADETKRRSHPAWVCGLKLLAKNLMTSWISHTLRGCVDWNSTLPYRCISFSVTPCVGVWIETIIYIDYWIMAKSHTLRGCVDWNYWQSNLKTFGCVTPCVGVWIETYIPLMFH